MAKCDEQLKIRVAREYLRGTESVQSLASRHGLSRSMVQRWGEGYRLHGVAGLRRQSGSYSASFKQSVLVKISREGLSDTEAANMLGIRSSSHIAKWRAQYDAGGIEALARKRRGASMPHKYPPEPVSKDMTKEELLEEVANLRAELDYLKKLDALIEAEKTKALVGKRKWSKD